MSEAQVSFAPNVLWKIKGVTGFCRIKGPSFTFLGARWNLSFVYLYNVNGQKSFIVLKEYGDYVKNSVSVTTFLTNGQNAYYSSTARLNDLSCREWIIWEGVDQNLKMNYDAGIIFILNKGFYFQCEFRLGSNWQSNRTTDGTLRVEPKISDYSPCIASLCHNFGNLFNNHLMSDVILECGDQKIYGHRNILAVRSEVFAAMFRNDMKEAKEKTVVIEDVEPSVLKQMVRYMYSGDILDLTPDSAHKVYAAADKHGVDTLKSKCAVFLVENPVGTIHQSPSVATGKTGEDSVKEAVLSHFASIKSLFSTDEWKKLSDKEPKFAQEAFQLLISKSF